MAVINLFVLLSGAVLICFFVGIHNVLTRFEENKCEMTYMFEYPQYVKISFSGNLEKKYPRYGLYAYGEGKHTERLRQMRFDGIPVLFIPGNSGSHKQMRSLASVSLRKSIDSRTPFHFDYFSMDFNEEYSALFGGVLQDQTEFTHLCIKKILGLYKSIPESPTSVILIGHSMGGMIAKGVFLEPDFKPSLVRLVISIATAHSSPVINVDRYIAGYYDNVAKYWSDNKSSGNVSHVTLVSIGGGPRDILVRSGLIRDQMADVNVLTTSIPAVWLSTDHLCSVWCKQLVLVIVRSLFDLVHDKQITTNSTESRQVFQYHMLQRSAGKRLSTSVHPAEVTLDPESDWSEDIRRQYTVVHPHGVKAVRHIMIRLLDDPKHQRLAVEAVYLTPKDWVFVCKANSVHKNSRVCDTATNLSNMSQIAPSEKYRRKLVYLNLAELKRLAYTHVILRIMPTNDMVQLNVDVYQALSRRVVAILPRWLSLMSYVVLGTTPDHAVHFEVMLPGLEHSWQSYLLHVDVGKCAKQTHHATAVFSVPWSNETEHTHITDLNNGVLQLRLHTPKPASYNGTDSPMVRLVLDPGCKYSIRIQSSLPDSFGQLVRFYGPQLLPYIAAILVLTLRFQLTCVGTSGECVMFHSALCNGAKPYYLLPLVKVASKLVGGGALAHALKPYLPLPDSVQLQAQGLDFFALPFVLYALGFAVVYVMGLAVWAVALFSGHAVHKMALRLVSMWLVGFLTWSEWILAGFTQLPIAVAAMLAALSLHTCGALSIWLAAAFYCFKLCKMYEDYLEDLFKYSIRLLLPGKGKKEVSGGGDKKDGGGNNKKDNSGKSKKDGSGGDSSGGGKREGGSNRSKKDMRKKEGSTGGVNGETVVKPHSFSLSPLHFHITVLLLWLTAAVVSIPSVLVWAHNYSYNTELSPDPSFEVGFIMCLCAGILWQGDRPTPFLKYTKFVSQFLFLVAALILMYAQLSLYLLAPLVTAAIVAVALHQFIGGLLNLNSPPEATLPSDKKDN